MPKKDKYDRYVVRIGADYRFEGESIEKGFQTAREALVFLKEQWDEDPLDGCTHLLELHPY